MNDQIIKKAVKYCTDNNHRLTEPRTLVLQTIASSKKPMKAYEILKEIGIFLYRRVSKEVVQ